MKKLTDLQNRYVDILIKMELLGDIKQAVAYRLAGSKCNPKNIDVEASRTLSLPQVSAALRRARARVKRAVEMTQDEILLEYAAIARSNIAGYYDKAGKLKILASLTKEQQMAIQAVEVDEQEYTNKNGKPGTRRRTKFRLHPKKAALDSLAKIKGMMQPDAGEAVSLALAMHEAMKDKENEAKNS